MILAKKQERIEMSKRDDDKVEKSRVTLATRALRLLDKYASSAIDEKSDELETDEDREELAIEDESENS